MTEFSKTISGRIYYEKTMPDIARQLKRIADALEKMHPNELTVCKECQEINCECEKKADSDT